jgi:hypothetical protein
MNTRPIDSYRPQPEDRSPIGPGEDTLRLIAGLPAPDGLANRMRAGLRAAPRGGWILMGRGPLRPPGGWMYNSLIRGLAAAGIVCVVAGGAWRIYSRVQPAAKAVVVPASGASHGGSGFSTAGSRHIPETLQGPVLNHPVVPPPNVNEVERAPGAPTAIPGGKVPKKKAPRSHALPPQ